MCANNEPLPHYHLNSRNKPVAATRGSQLKLMLLFFISHTGALGNVHTKCSY